MSAAEIIEQIKRLSPEEQREVFNYVQQHEDASGALRDHSDATYLDKKTFDAAAKWAVDEHRELLRRLAK
jgi:hypothetical protein